MTENQISQNIISKPNSSAYSLERTIMATETVNYDARESTKNPLNNLSIVYEEVDDTFISDADWKKIHLSTPTMDAIKEIGFDHVTQVVGRHTALLCSTFSKKNQAREILPLLKGKDVRGVGA